ncbi:hypothetical protein PFISCL1PPCAC_1101, partial [Pristionchus fissidentatus]
LKQKSSRRLLQIINLVAYTFSMIFFSVMLRIHYNIRYTFHPVFSFYFALIFGGYILCAICIVGYAIFAYFLSEETQFMTFLERSTIVTYSYLTPLKLFLTIERLSSTVLVRKYENIRPWSLVVASQFLCV